MRIQVVQMQHVDMILVQTVHVEQRHVQTVHVVVQHGEIIPQHLGFQIVQNPEIREQIKFMLEILDGDNGLATAAQILNQLAHGKWLLDPVGIIQVLVKTHVEQLVQEIIILDGLVVVIGMEMMNGQILVQFVNNVYIQDLVQHITVVQMHLHADINLVRLQLVEMQHVQHQHVDVQRGVHGVHGLQRHVPQKPMLDNVKHKQFITNKKT